MSGMDLNRVSWGERADHCPMFIEAAVRGQPMMAGPLTVSREQWGWRFFHPAFPMEGMFVHMFRRDFSQEHDIELGQVRWPNGRATIHRDDLLGFTSVYVYGLNIQVIRVERPEGSPLAITVEHDAGVLVAADTAGQNFIISRRRDQKPMPGSGGVSGSVVTVDNGRIYGQVVAVNNGVMDNRAMRFVGSDLQIEPEFVEPTDDAMIVTIFAPASVDVVRGPKGQ